MHFDLHLHAGLIFTLYSQCVSTRVSGNVNAQILLDALPRVAGFKRDQHVGL